MSTLRAIRERYLPAIESRLGEFHTQAERSGIRMDAEMSRYHFATGGKRLRALIPCWVYATFDRDPADAMGLGCAIEMIHNATLVHDDLQDRDEVRRGLPTVWKKYSEPQSINCGDAMFQFGFDLLLSLPHEPRLLTRIARRVVRATLEVIEGQSQEFLMKDEPYPTVSRYLEVIRGKTAALIALPVATAMETLELDPALCDYVHRMAVQCGLIFQMQDDLLDIYGEKMRDRPASDIAEGKVSILVAELNEAASAPDRERLSQILKLPREETTSERITEALALFDRYEVKTKTIARIREIQRSIAGDRELEAEPRAHALLTELAEQFLEPIRSIMNGGA